MMDALKWLLPALHLMGVTHVPDAPMLAAAGEEYAVPASVMVSVKIEETRRSLRNTEISYAGAVGEMQVMPTIWLGRGPCRRIYGPRHINNNRRCGAYILRYYRDRCGDWDCAEFRYVGGDSAYVKSVEFRRVIWALDGVS